MNKTTNGGATPKATIPDHQIGEVFFSIDPTLETEGPNAIRLGPERVLSKSTYLKLYLKLKSTNLLSVDIDGDPNFTIKNLEGFDYLKNVPDGVTVDTLGQNIPIPNLDCTIQSASHTHDLDDQNGSTGATKSLGEQLYNIKGWTNTTYNEGLHFQNDGGTVAVVPYDITTETLSGTVGGSNDGDARGGIHFPDASRKLTGFTNTQSASHNHSVSVNTANSPSYTTAPEVRPNTLMLYMYIRADV